MRTAAGYAQCRNFQTAGQTLEAAIRRGEAAIHRGGRTFTPDAPARVPRLQVPTAKEKSENRQTTNDHAAAKASEEVHLVLLSLVGGRKAHIEGYE